MPQTRKEALDERAEFLLGALEEWLDARREVDSERGNHWGPSMRTLDRADHARETLLRAIREQL